jgi:hypothetical protein
LVVNPFGMTLDLLKIGILGYSFCFVDFLGIFLADLG